MLKIPKLNNKNSRINNGRKKVFTFQVLFLLCLVLFGISIHQNAQAAISYFSPSSGNFTVGNIFTINVVVNTEGVVINNAEAVINFPKDLLEIVSFNKSGSIFSLWVEEPVFSNSAGTFSFNGGLPTPGFNGAAGKALGAVFRVKKAGSASLVFSSAAIRANDGYGTNVFKTGVQAIFNLISEEEPSVLEKETAPIPVVSKVPAAPAISSSTHADSNKWYANKNPQFSWTLPPDVNGVSLYLSKSPTSNPGPVSDGLLSSKSYQDIDDGTWYFHVRLKNAAGWGAISHFRFQVDTEAPDVLGVAFQEGKETDNPRPTITVNYKDSLSGTTGYCEVKVDNGEWFASNYESRIEEPDKPCAFKLPLQNPGKHTVLVKALDEAGNYSLVSEEFVIKALTPPKITEYPQRLMVGGIFVFRGETVYPNSRVIVWIQRTGEEPKSHIVRSDEEGKFIFVSWERLQEGVYRFWAQVIDSRGAKSEPSDKLTSIVEPSAFIRIGSWAIDFLAVAVSLAALLFTFVFIIWRGWHKLALLRRRLRKEVREAELALHKAFNLLKEDVREQITLLERTRIRRKLTKEEGKIIKQLNKDLEDAEKFIGKEIEDIEKEVK